MKTITMRCLILMMIILPVFLLPAEDEKNGNPVEKTEVLLRSLQEMEGEMIRIRTSGGGEFQGILLNTTPERTEILNAEGQIITIATGEIREALTIESFYQDAAANKLLLMPLGFGMDPGEFHIADQELFIVSTSYGLSEHFSLWGAISVPGILLNARFSIEPGTKTGVSLGSFIGTLFIEPMFIAIPYGIVSFGSLNNNFTLGLGSPFIYSRQKAKEDEPASEYMIFGGIAAVGGKIVISRTASFITENWVILARGYDRIAAAWWNTVAWFFPTIAFRIAGSRFSWDIGISLPVFLEYSDEKGKYSFIWPFVENVPIPIPVLGFTYRIR